MNMDPSDVRFVVGAASMFVGSIAAKSLAEHYRWVRAAKVLRLPLGMKGRWARRRFIQGELDGRLFAVRMLPPVRLSGVGGRSSHRFYPTGWEIKLARNPPDIRIGTRDEPFQEGSDPFDSLFEVSASGGWLNAARRDVLAIFAQAHSRLDLTIDDQEIRLVLWSKLAFGQLEDTARDLSELASKLEHK